MVNAADIYQKIKENKEFSEQEVLALLKELENFQSLAAYLAQCHAASAEMLPASASKATKARYLLICSIAEKGLGGDISGIRYPSKVSTAKTRCAAAVALLAAPVK